MLYDAYKERILKIVRILDYIRRHAIVISAAAALLLATVITLLATKGLVGDVKGPAEITYGETYVAKVSAFLSSSHLEYRAEGGQWSTEVPIYPGTYTVRGVGKSSGGKPRYGKETTLTILKKVVDVTTAESEIEYGFLPQIQEKGLVYGDLLRCEDFVFEDPVSAVTNITPIAESITIYAKDGRDVTDAYILHPVTTAITRTPRPISVTVQEAVHEYDGQKFTYEVYEQSGGTLVEGDVLQAKFTASLTDAGRLENAPTLQILNGEGRDVTHLYAIRKQYGDLVVEKRPLVITTASDTFLYDGADKTTTGFDVDAGTPLVPGHRIEVAAASGHRNVGSYENTLTFRVLTPDGRDVTSNYAITTINGTVKIDPRPITVTTAGGEWIYDGVAHSAPEATVEGLVQGHVLFVQTASSITDAGSKQNELSVDIIADKELVTANYAITYLYGTLTVSKRPVTIKTASRAWTYDDKPHSITTYEVLSELDLVPTHKIQFINAASITDVGSIDNTTGGVEVYMSGQMEVTDNYEITEQYGTLTIQQRPVRLQPITESVVYDGQPHGDRILATNLALVDGHTVSATVSGVRTDVGTATLTLEGARILKGTEDKTANYRITLAPGEITILPRLIRVVLTDAVKEYDGLPLTSQNIVIEPVDLPYYELVSGHQVANLQVRGSQTDIGGSVNFLVSCDIRDQNGGNVTHNYSIERVSGRLTVIPRKITLTSGSAQKEYDGTPLTCKDPIALASGTLLAGHSLQMEATGSITEVGRTENTITGTIRDGSGREVIRFYDITYKGGVLRVTKGNHGGSGGGGGGELNESGDMRGPFNGDEEKETVILMVRSEKTGSAYFRLKSFGNFTGQSWTEAEEYGELLNGTYSYNYLTGVVLKNAGITDYRIEVQSYTSQYMLPYHLAIGETKDYTVQKSDVKYAGAGANGQYSLPYYLYDGYGQDLLGMLPDEYAAEELQYRKFVHDQYLFVDDETRAFLEGIIREQGFSGSDAQVIEKVASYVQNAATYNLQYNSKLDEAANAVIAFLSIYKEGVCRHYAASATMLYRALGIPARYVIGYAGHTTAGEWSKIVSPGHAWVEVYIDGVGWLPVEVTGGGFELGGTNANKLTVKPTYQSKVYDGTPLVATNDIEITPTLAELLAKGYTFTAEVSGILELPGKGNSRVQSFRLFDPQGADVTDAYHISYKTGLMEIFSPELSLVRIYLYCLQKYYDGTPLVFGQDDFEILEIPDGVRLELQLNISRTDAGYLTLGDLNERMLDYVSYRLYRESDGADVTNLHRVVFDVFDTTPTDYMPLRIDPRPLELTANSATKEYDGDPLMSTGVTVTFGSLLPGHCIDSVSILGHITEVGSKLCAIKEESILILDAAGNDVTTNYQITTKTGTLTVVEAKEQ